MKWTKGKASLLQVCIYEHIYVEKTSENITHMYKKAVRRKGGGSHTRHINEKDQKECREKRIGFKKSEKCRNVQRRNTTHYVGRIIRNALPLKTSPFSVYKSSRRRQYDDVVAEWIISHYGDKFRVNSLKIDPLNFHALINSWILVD